MSLRYDERTGRAKLTIYAGRDVTGRQRQRTKTWHARSLRQARKDADRYATEIRDELEERLERGATVNGLVDEWLRKRDALDSPSTISARKAAIGRIRAGLGKVPLDKLSARHIDQWMTDLRVKGLRDTTIANHYTALRAILRQGRRWKMVTSIATEDTEPPRRQRRRPKPPTASAVDLLIAAASPDLRLCAELAAQAGLRRGEVLGLRWSDIDWERRLLNVNRALLAGPEVVTKLPKSNQPRTVPVSKVVIELLADQRTRQALTAALVDEQLAGDGWVIADLATDPTGLIPRKADWLSHAWLKHRDRHGSSATFHDLRHWHATELIDAGVPLPVVQKRLGHLQLTTTANVYVDSVGESEALAADVISRRRALPAPPPHTT